jgi:GrpB-like predicted nucleotidyltransferase (UPF0157 family)
VRRDQDGASRVLVPVETWLRYRHEASVAPRRRGTLGVRESTISVRLSLYDPEWRSAYAAEADRVAAALGDVVEIAHVGSTSVPGLAGKPTVDIAAAVRSLALPDQAHRRLAAIGYSYGGSLGLPQHVFRKGQTVPWRFLVHVVDHNGQMWRDFLLFRDHLRSHPADATAYEALKRELLDARGTWYHGVDKESFIRTILDANART